MKHINKLFKQLAGVAVLATLAACNDYLDQEPMSQITPDKYLNEESQLATYANGLYADILPSHGNWSYGTFGTDEHTDNQATKTYDNKFVPGQWRTAQTENSDKNYRKWFFERIYSCNYFLDNVLPKLEAGTLTGSADNINHYVGEIYFLRAHEYFKRYQMFGDFPIIRNTLPDQMDPLVEASKRSPRTEVARFIISDLDSAIMLMATTPDKNKTRISKEAALLLKSRVALFEGTWLKYFKGTAFVPNGDGWPGKDKDYNAGYQFPSGSIDGEIDYFLTQAMDAAKQVADATPLVENTGHVQQDAAEPVNPYMDMFGDVDLSGYSEVLLWRPYNKGLGQVHCVVVGAQNGDYGVGVTRGMVDGFLMSDGMPIYASSAYKGDKTISDVRADRDSRLTIFLKEPGQKNVLFESNEGTHAVLVEPNPAILETSLEKTYTTGYALRKGNSYYQNQCANGNSYTGSITFRAVEAYLNYMEACYEKNGSLDATAQDYWRAIRSRAKVDTDFNKTIAATQMSEEAKNDWGAYSAGQLIDPTLYNIRRERRCELMAEGLRFMDLCRWRAMDQMIKTPYHIEGFRLWAGMDQWYKNEDGSSRLVYGLDNPSANVSDPAFSEYLRPYEISGRSVAKDGYRWAMAHYLQPICIQHLMISANGGDISASPIYQNPGWPTTANQGANE